MERRSHHEPWAAHHFELQLTRKFGVHIHSFYIRNRRIRNQYLILTELRNRVLMFQVHKKLRLNKKPRRN